jgi:hypothetical protein
LHSYLHQKPENTPPSTIPLDLGLAKLIAVWGSLPATKRKAVLRAAGIKPTR